MSLHVTRQKQLVEDAFAPGLSEGEMLVADLTGKPSMRVEVKVPQLPESVSEATLVGWHKKAGDAVARDENLVDVETDKIVLELPAPQAACWSRSSAATAARSTGGEVVAMIDSEARRRRGAVRRGTRRPPQPRRPRARRPPRSGCRARSRTFRAGCRRTARGAQVDGRKGA